MPTLTHQKIVLDPLRFIGIADVALLGTKTPSPNDKAATDAIAQMVIVDAVTSRVDRGKLYVNTMPLSEVRFLDSARLSAEPTETFDMHRFLDQPVIRAATSVLVKHVAQDTDRVFMLTTRHSMVPSDITNTYFIFDREQEKTTDTSYLVFDVEGDNQSAYRATKIYWPEPNVHENPQKIDFCLIELEANAQTRLKSRALRLAQAFPTEPGPDTLYSVSHPLGIPCKRSDAMVISAAPDPTPRMICDFASGGSGSPVIHDTGDWLEVVAVLTGNARFTKHDRVKHRGHWYVRPRQLETTDDAALQPLVSATTIRAILDNL